MVTLEERPLFGEGLRQELKADPGRAARRRGYANYENVPIFVKTFRFLELYLYKEIKMQHLEIVCNEK